MILFESQAVYNYVEITFNRVDIFLNTTFAEAQSHKGK